MLEVEQADPVADHAPVLPDVLDFHPLHEHPVVAPILLDEGRGLLEQELTQGLLARGLGDAGVEPVHGLLEPLPEDDLPEVGALGARLAGDAFPHGIAEVLEPVQGFLFGHGLGDLEAHGAPRS
jgi:hypothetical protein